MTTQLLLAEKISNFLGIKVYGDSNGMVEFRDVTDYCKNIADFEENAEAGQCFDLGESEGYIYKITDDEGNYYSVVKSGESLSNY